MSIVKNRLKVTATAPCPGCGAKSKRKRLNRKNSGQVFLEFIHRKKPCPEKTREKARKESLLVLLRMKLKAERSIHDGEYNDRIVVK